MIARRMSRERLEFFHSFFHRTGLRTNDKGPGDCRSPYGKFLLCRSAYCLGEEAGAWGAEECDGAGADGTDAGAGMPDFAL